MPLIDPSAYEPGERARALLNHVRGSWLPYSAVYILTHATSRWYADDRFVGECMSGLAGHGGAVRMWVDWKKAAEYAAHDRTASPCDRAVLRLVSALALNRPVDLPPFLGEMDDQAARAVFAGLAFLSRSETLHQELDDCGGPTLSGVPLCAEDAA
ncbi:hypothetical protein [Salininema proteolyticum]|uniref:Uncharacterized protein n=1 Tax=Salininema proteolyticum TaxID=1607685 RepID=A0ABV8U253_9ACTN